MTNYKKEEPRSYPDWGQLHTPKVPKTVEHYLADILCAATEIIKDDNSTCQIQNVAEDIIKYVHRAWDLIDD